MKFSAGKFALQGILLNSCSVFMCDEHGVALWYIYYVFTICTRRETVWVGRVYQVTGVNMCDVASVGVYIYMEQAEALCVAFVINQCIEIGVDANDAAVVCRGDMPFCQIVLCPNFGVLRICRQPERCRDNQRKEFI